MNQVTVEKKLRNNRIMFNSQKFLELTLEVNNMSMIDAVHAYFDCGLQIVPFTCEKNQHGFWMKKPVFIPRLCEGWRTHPITTKDALTKIYDGRLDYFIAIVVPETITIIDVDPRNNGDVNQDYLYESLVTLTPSGGVHSWRSIPVTHSCSKLDDYPGVDFKTAHKGLIIVPPSIRPDYPGSPYIFVNQSAGFAPMPEKILKSLIKPRITQRLQKIRNPQKELTANPAWLINDLKNTSEGQRNIKFFNYTCLMLEAKNSSDNDLQQLYEAALLCGLEAKSVDKTYQSALERVKR